MNGLRKYGLDFKHVEKVGEIVKGEIYLLGIGYPFDKTGYFKTLKISLMLLN